MTPSSSLDGLFIALILVLTFISIIIKLSATLQILKMCYLHQIQNKNMDF